MENTALGGTLQFVLFAKCWCHQSKALERDRRTDMKHEELQQNAKLEGRSHFGDLCVDGR